ncbi:unnamed protein product [Fusarium graminearum]|nr:unnamed protein product [Fusarium graminearum]
MGGRFAGSDDLKHWSLKVMAVVHKIGTGHPAFRFHQSGGNLTTGLDLSDLDETVASLLDGLADGLGGLGLTLGADNVGLTLLLGTLDDESCSLSILLGNLLLLNGLCEFTAKGHVGNGDILEGDVELGGTEGEVVADAVGDSLSLGDELCGIELGDNGL